jgi:Protein of unknown function (DUF2934)
MLVGGRFNMHPVSKVAVRIEMEDEVFNEDVVNEGLHIEEILHRAYQIHRARGGMIGYDLEDWLQAERESIGEISQPVSIPKDRSGEARLLEICTPGFKRGETGEPS